MTASNVEMQICPRNFVPLSSSEWERRKDFKVIKVDVLHRIQQKHHFSEQPQIKVLLLLFCGEKKDLEI